MPTGSVGSQTFAVNGVDKVGNTNAASASYAVTYAVCPVGGGEAAVSGRAGLPIRIALCDANGRDVPSAGVTVTAEQISVSGGATSVPATAEGQANPGNAFRFDPTLGTAGGYIYNLSTRDLAPGTYQLSIHVQGDPVATHQVTFQVK